MIRRPARRKLVKGRIARRYAVASRHNSLAGLELSITIPANGYASWYRELIVTSRPPLFRSAKGIKVSTLQELAFFGISFVTPEKEFLHLRIQRKGGGKHGAKIAASQAVRHWSAQLMGSRFRSRSNELASGFRPAASSPLVREPLARLYERLQLIRVGS